MLTAENYRKLAQNCFDWHREATDPDVKKDLYLMAKRFMSRALEIELHGSTSSLPPGVVEQVIDHALRL